MKGTKMKDKITVGIVCAFCIGMYWISRTTSITSEGQTYITGYVHAIINHTGEADEAKVRGQFSIRNVAGDIVNNNEGDSSTNKETENV